MMEVQAGPRAETPLHYAWRILTACCALNGATLGIVINCKGLFFAPVCAELGCPVSALTAYTIFYGLSAVVMLLRADRILARYPIRWVLTLSLLVLCGATAAMGTFHSLPLWYAAGTVQGISGAFLLYIPVPMLINHWFSQRRGFALGMAATASGVLGAVINPVLSTVIATWGWRTAYVVQGGVAFALAAPFTLFVIVRRPEELGLVPYGRGTAKQRSRPSPVTAGCEGGRKKLLCCMLFAASFTFCATYAQHLANFAAASGWDGHIGAVMVSSCMVGNICAKAVLGVACDRWGGRRACLASLLLVMLGFLLLSGGAPWRGGLFFGAFLIGIDHANMTVLVPIAVGAVSTPETFDHRISRVTMATMLTSAFSATVIAAFYDFLGSYAVVFLLGAVLQILCMGLAVVLFQRT
ncbi:MAG: MFS transporter [Oscillibacter sp.]|nr:MFS transporter [Oscillibacter sp.]